MPGHALRILIVEDQCLIAKQLEVIMASAGHDVVGTATTRDAAVDLASKTRPDIAFVDVNLADGSTGMEVATTLSERCWSHVVFTTANRRRLPTNFCGAIGVVEKPFTRSGLLAALNYMGARLIYGVGIPAKPESLVLSPDYAALWIEPAAG